MHVPRGESPDTRAIRGARRRLWTQVHVGRARGGHGRGRPPRGTVCPKPLLQSPGPPGSSRPAAHESSGEQSTAIGSPVLTSGSSEGRLTPRAATPGRRECAMDVQCERCKTEYEFDDALVSGRGTTVRCTNCGHQFKVRGPEATGRTPATSGWCRRPRAGARLPHRCASSSAPSWQSRWRATTC